jgi:predicted SAM-dependent methyltransferase
LKYDRVTGREPLKSELPPLPGWILDGEATTERHRGTIRLRSARVRDSRTIKRVKLRLRDRVRSQPPHWAATRDDLAFRYLRGDGIEIGALNHPQRLPAGARARYVDHADQAGLEQAYPWHDWLQAPDVVDEAERLASVGDESVDFVVANHVLEHVEDPVTALQTFLRVLRPGGILFITLPDPRHSFDGRRERTTVDHVLRDHRDGPETSRQQHYEEWAHIVEGLTDPQDIERRTAEFAREETRNHFHVWEPDAFLELLFALDLPIAIEATQVTEPEFAVVARKR